MQIPLRALCVCVCIGCNNKGVLWALIIFITMLSEHMHDPLEYGSRSENAIVAMKNRAEWRGQTWNIFHYESSVKMRISLFERNWWQPKNACDSHFNRQRIAERCAPYEFAHQLKQRSVLNWHWNGIAWFYVMFLVMLFFASRMAQQVRKPIQMNFE